MRVLSIGSAFVTDAGVAALPKNLRTLSLTNARNLTSACIPLLPRELTALAVPNLFIVVAISPPSHTWICLNGYIECPDIVHVPDVPLLPPALVKEAERIVRARRQKI